MIVKICVLALNLFAWDVLSAKMDNTLSIEAAGWLKFHPTPRTRDEAWIICHQMGAVLASPLNVPVRDAVKRLLNNDVHTILTGVKAELSTGDYVSSEGVPLSSMPVIIESSAPETFEDSEICVVWNTYDHTAKYASCDVKQPFVCYQKIGPVPIVGCGTTDLAYKVDLRTKSCYKHHVIKKTWTQAYRTCHEEGAKLAVVNSETEAVVLREMVKGHKPVRRAFINLKNWAESGTYWEAEGISLEDSGFNRWHGGQPNNLSNNVDDGSVYCGSISYHGDLFDDSCDIPRTFICEKKQEILTVAPLS